MTDTIKVSDGKLVVTGAGNLATECETPPEPSPDCTNCLTCAPTTLILVVSNANACNALLNGTYTLTGSEIDCWRSGYNENGRYGRVWCASPMWNVMVGNYPYLVDQSADLICGDGTLSGSGSFDANVGCLLCGNWSLSG